MEIFKSNKYIRDYLKNFSVDKHNQLAESILVIGIDFIKKIYDPSEIVQKVRIIANNIINTEYSSKNNPDLAIKDDIMKIQEEICKLNNKFEHEMAACICKKPTTKPHQKKANQQNEKKEKKEKKPFKIYNLPKTESQKKLLDSSITPKITEIKHAFIKKPSPFHTKHHLDDTEMRKVFKSNDFEEDDFNNYSSNQDKREKSREKTERGEKQEKLEAKRSASPPQKLTSPDSQKNVSSRAHVPKYLKKVGSKIKDIVDHHKQLNTFYKKYNQSKTEGQVFREEYGLRNNSEEENHKYNEYLSNSHNFLSSEKREKFGEEDPIFNGDSHGIEQEYFSNGDNIGKVLKDRKKEENFTDHVKSPTFLNVESQYLEKEASNNESSQIRPRALEFEKTSNFSSNFNTRYNNLNNVNINNLIENSGSKKRTENNFNDLGGVKKEQSKMISETKEFEINTQNNFKYTGDNFNDKESSVSSNFSMFQPNEELKSFYQKELWNNRSFQKKTGQAANFMGADEDSDDEGFDE